MSVHSELDSVPLASQKTALPRHVVLVPDGNRRWAKQRALPSFSGHKAGAEAIEPLFKMAHDLGVHSLTFWGCSVSNVTERSGAEVAFLYQIFEEYFRKLGKRDEIYKDQIRIQVLGRWQEFFPKSLQDVITDLIKKTESHQGRNLTFLMAYDGRDEMKVAIRGIAADKILPEEIDGEVIKSHLWTKNLPPVDLVIRPGGEPHWSAGLLMWDVAEARLYFTETLWPDFSKEEFQKALDIYASTERRFGK